MIDLVIELRKRTTTRSTQIENFTLPAHADHQIVSTAVNGDRTTVMYVPREHRAQYMRAGPKQTRLLFKYMPLPFYLPEEVVAMHTYDPRTRP